MTHENLFKIYIPEPCHENWDKMTPNQQGAFCTSCSKTVVDFSDKSDEELNAFISENIDNKICGRFRVSQLSETPKLKNEIPRIEFPGYLFPISYSPLRAYALALFVVASMAVAGCGNSDGSGTGDKDKIERTTGAYEVMPDSMKPKDINKSDSVKPQINYDETTMGAVNYKLVKDKGVKIDTLKEVRLLGKPVMKENFKSQTDTNKFNNNEEDKIDTNKVKINNHVKMGLFIKSRGK